MTLVRLLSLVLQLGCLMLIADLFRLGEAYGFRQLIPVILFGFVVHSVLPVRYRLPFFLFLSLAAVASVLGWQNCLTLTFFGLCLFGICHLPVSFKTRVGLLLLVATALALVRVGVLETPLEELPTMILPILGSMFMFRVILYLYDQRHSSEQVSIWGRLSYFFMLPNVCYPLFPVVDYGSFHRKYYEGSVFETYETGIQRIFRGITHLLLYRLVYQYATPNPASIVDLSGVAFYVFSSFLLYLRISGLFHLAVGVLSLFGFNLPEANHRYLLAAGFTDFWRRINIYWKDFMVRVVYNPLLTKFRRRGFTGAWAIAVATLLTIAVSWLLHSYQWFWLRGAFPLSFQDGAFWIALGVLAAVNAVINVKFPAKRSLVKARITWRAAAVRSVKVAGTFLTISLMWSFWTARSISEWWSVMSVAASSTSTEFLVLLLIVGLAVAAGTLSQMAADSEGLSGILQPGVLVRPTRWAMTGVLLFFALGWPVLNSLGLRSAENRAVVATTRVLGAIKGNQLNQRDEERLVRGYYEELIGTDSWDSAVWSVKVRKPADWGRIRLNGVAADTDDLRLYELLPSMETSYMGAPLRTNQWGMRDREYTKQKPADAVRIVLLGSSYTMGSGVADGKTFEALVEDRLNETWSKGRSYEILNFAVPGYSILSSVVQAQKKAVFGFEPDLLLVTGARSPEVFLARTIRSAIEEGIAIDDPVIEEAVRASGASAPNLSSEERERRIRGSAEAILRRSYQRLTSVAEEHGVIPVWVYLPTTYEVAHAAEENFREVSKLPREAGFLTFAIEAYGNPADKSLWVAPWDNHVNGEGHRLIAERLYRILTENALELGLAG